MQEADIPIVSEAFANNGIHKSKDYLTRCWQENLTGERVTLLAFYQGQFAGSLHLLAKSYYPYFVENNIPEVNDFNVIPPLRRMGIGKALMDAVEKLAFDKYGVVGLGVGLYASYGSAMRMYARRGYIPDGRGVVYQGQVVPPGSQVRLDDDLNIFMVKKA